ncbi:helix-turn-helix domain-containing protein [Pseudomonas plecoglossicida]|uniref:helix-turn-helix domain-containing protein n=1 Tax=Pseudomonas TaxID=286 RepID=UPI0007614F46|nr:MULTISPECIES: helix-turn-helix domain-containing protein [Pseudomonas]MDQ7965163.1 helix-turn-helix domain-containing protein [Pseudomonas plecoglossicida]WBM44607.1 helix-turn-helix domain-containing protein [Pseudomonas putida]WFG01031.1 helix-turn-helix domain-containing protein [Pseudomonas putida]
MSMELMVKAMKTKVGNPLRKLVLIKLADNANDMGECWPSYQHVADQCEIARSTVKSHIRELEKAGLVRREYRRKGDLNQSNLFHLNLDGGFSPAPGGGAADDLPRSAENPGGSADDLPRAADDLGGGAADDPRTSHSFEAVIEPVTEPVATQAEAVVAEGVVVPFVAQQPRCEIPADMPGPKDPACKTFKAWANYAMAYRKRYHAWPVWNAKAGGQVGQLISRLGIEAAHHVAAFYLRINDAKLINGCHNLGDLLAKAEAYHTQWVTNRQMNATTARQQEQTQANMNAAQEAADAIRNGQGGKRNAFL